MFQDLPKDLKNIVCEFAYGARWDLVQKDVKTCLEIKNMGISGVFTRQTMWSPVYRTYMPSPLLNFEPIRNFGRWLDYIDWHAVQEFLWRLDFRRRFVRLIASREQWRQRLKKNWRNIKMFDDFYRFLLYTRVPCFKPLWKPVGFRALKSYRSPVVSATWWFELSMGV